MPMTRGVLPMAINILLTGIVLIVAAWLFVSVCFGAVMTIFDESFAEMTFWLFVLPVLLACTPIVKAKRIMFPNGLPLWLIMVLFVLIVSAGPIYLIWS